MSSKLGRSLIGPLSLASSEIGEVARRIQRRRLLAALAALVLAGCADEPAPAPEPEPAGPVAERILRVDGLTLGRTHDGFMLAAFGVAETAGWRLPRLAPVGSAPGADGFLTFDYVAIPPEAPLAAPESARRVRADAPIDPGALRGAAGVRVRAATGAVEAAIGGG